MITAVIGDEDDQIGTRRISERGYRADFAVVGEPTGLDLCTAHKGVATYEVTRTGKAAHASVLHEGMNAIYKMNRVIHAIERFSLRLEEQKTHPRVGGATISVGKIQGGTCASSVPDSCKITADRRILPGEDAETGRRELENLMGELRRSDSDLVAEARTTFEGRPVEITENQPVVYALRKSLLTVTGQSAEIIATPYTTDAAILVNEMNLPTVVFGPGDYRQAHSPDESIPVDEMMQASKIFALTALEILRRQKSVSQQFMVPAKANEQAPQNCSALRAKSIRT